MSHFRTMLIVFYFLVFPKAQQGNNSMLLQPDWFPSSDSKTRRHPLTFVIFGKLEDGQSLDAK